MSTKKPGSPAKKSAAVHDTRRKQQRPQKSAEAVRQKNQYIALVLFAVSIFFTCLILIEGESVWKWTHDLLLGLFGTIAIVWPLFLMGIAVLLTLEKTSGKIRTKLILVAVILFFLCAAVYIFRSGSMPEGLSYGALLKELFIMGTNRYAVGLVGGLIGHPLVAAFGATGAKIVILLVLFVAIMILTGTSLIQLFRTVTKPVDKVAQSINDARERRQTASPRSIIDVPLDGEEPAAQYTALPGDSILPIAQIPPSETPENNEKLERLQRVFGVGEPGEKQSAGERAVPAQKTIPSPIKSSIPLTEGDEVTAQAMARHKKEPASNLVIDPVQTTIYTDTPPNDGKYHFPPLSMLEESKHLSAGTEAEELQTNSKLLVDTLKSFGVSAKMLDISRGPSVTRYELQPAAGVKISKITNLADDIAMNLAASGVRIEAPIPGKAAIGIEVPNKHKAMVRMRDILESNSFSSAKSRLTVALGRDIAGQTVVADLAKMPHLLIAGTTGSGKSVCINAFLMSLLYKATPEEVRLLMIDPKVVELRVYNGIPHLLVPVVTDPRKAAGALGWAVNEMMKRYKIFADCSVRDLVSYNKLAETGTQTDENGELLQKLPEIVIFIDELADLMMVAPNEVEDAICRLAQLARAAGIHLVVATQRPSVDVITGLIKANIPSRIAFTVSSAVDSRTILDMGGAEKLLGYGDMLFAPVGAQKPLRIQGCYVSDEEVESVIEFVKKTQSEGYDEGILDEIEKNAAASDEKSADSGNGDNFDDPMMTEAIECVVEAGQASTSLLQRRLRLGYARAGRLIDQMEQLGIVGPHEGSKPRQVLLSRQQWLEMNMQRNNSNTEEQS